MKKVILAAVVLGAISFTSCKKSYDCECLSATTLEVTTVSEKGKDADDACKKASGLKNGACTPKK